MTAPKSVDEYLSSLSEEQRRALESVRRTIKAAVPEATEGIAYEMPAFRLRGRFLVSYAAYKKHLSLFPASGAVLAALGTELEPYLSGKGTIRFTAAEPLPASLVRKIVKKRVEEVGRGA